MASFLQEPIFVMRRLCEHVDVLRMRPFFFFFRPFLLTSFMIFLIIFIFRRFVSSYWKYDDWLLGSLMFFFFMESVSKLPWSLSQNDVWPFVDGIGSAF